MRKENKNNETNNDLTDASVDYLSDLQNQALSGKITIEEMLKLVEEDVTRKQVLSNYHIKQLPEGRYWVRLDNKQVIKKKTLKEVEDAIMAYHKNSVVTLTTVFPTWKSIRSKQRKAGTFRKDMQTWERFINGSPIANIPLTDLKNSDGYKWFDYCLSLKPDMREKYFKNIHGTLNCILEWCVTEQLILRNPLQSIYVEPDFFAQPVQKEDHDKVFSFEEQEAVKKLAYKDAMETRCALPLGINILFNLGIRDGELCGLKWKDILDNRIHIRRQIVEDCDVNGKMTGFKVVDHTKSKSGDRILVLNSEAQNLFHKIKVYNLDQGIPISDEDFIFQRILKDGTISFCNTRSFEPRIKKYCRQAGMSELKSQHDVRRTVITNLYDAGVPLKEIQRIAGHSSLKQTLDYIKFRDHNNDEEYMEKLCSKKLEQVGTKFLAQ